MTSRLACMIMAVFVGCVPTVRAGPTAPSPPRAPLRSGVLPEPYAADQAVRDALASPLELVGIGGWRGYYRKLSCIYRNDRVLVVDVRCTKRESSRFEVVVFSPGRGRISIGVAAPENTRASKIEHTRYQTFGIIGHPWWEGTPPFELAMTYDEIAAYEVARGRKFPQGCAVSAQRPEGRCNSGAPFTVAAFTAAHIDFLRAPPDGWHQRL